MRTMITIGVGFIAFKFRNNNSSLMFRDSAVGPYKVRRRPLVVIVYQFFTVVLCNSFNYIDGHYCSDTDIFHLVKKN